MVSAFFHEGKYKTFLRRSIKNVRNKFKLNVKIVSKRTFWGNSVGEMQVLGRNHNE